MRTRGSLSFAALTLCAASTAFAQKPTTPPAPVPPAPGSVPAPTPAPAGSSPAAPAYAQPPQPQQQQPAAAPQTVPVPEKKGPVVAPPEKPTPEAPYIGYVPYAPVAQKPAPDRLGSAYIPLDSWIYPAMTRLYGLGYVNTMYLGMRPWTRRSVLHMLERSEPDIINGDDEQAKEILAKVMNDLSAEVPHLGETRGLVWGLYSSYTRPLGITGPVLVDSYHLGQTIYNDYGRPYQSGFNNVTGASTLEEWGPFSLFVRGEYQHAPSAEGYSRVLYNELSTIDLIYDPIPPAQATIPLGPISDQNPFRLVEAYASVHVLGHEISGGKSDAWMGPATGSSMAWSNNAENIYSFRVNRVEPLNIPYLSKLLGPIRYDFFVGALPGHQVPVSPWVHAEMFSFRPTDNFEFSFQRTIIWGGKGHSPVTLGTFFKGFFDISDTTAEEKAGRNDPGARFSDFSASYRLPKMRKYVTFVMDSITHDDVTPISAPRRASFRTGLYVSQIPGMRRMDFRVEAVSTDPGVGPAHSGQFAYWETVQRQGYTHNGIIMGDWIGREAKGGQAWLTYNFSANEWVQLEYLNKKTPFNFIPGGTTQNQFKVDVVKRLGKEVELNAWVQTEGWKAPVYKDGLQRNTAIAAQFTWYPKLRNYNAPH